jgi:hypothetical protein
LGADALSASDLAGLLALASTGGFAPGIAAPLGGAESCAATALARAR